MTVQDKNICWYLPRPKPDHYKGGMPLYAEEWLIREAKGLLGTNYPRILNVFCGMNKMGIRVDLNPEVNPDFCGDVHHLSDFLKGVETRAEFDIILADPPYSTEESKELYGTGPLKYKKWTAECDKFLRPGGILIVYHKLVPANPNPEKYVAIRRVSILNRTWHLPRVAVFFQKKVEQ